MSQYLLLHRIEVQNANCISGFTWGFPAITHFLGFTHHLQRKLADSFDLVFGGCAVICHQSHSHTYQSRLGRDIEFIQSKNPPYLKDHKEGKTPPIIEEGRMNMTVSLVIQLDKAWMGSSEDKEELEKVVYQWCQFGRLAGGTVLKVAKVSILSARNNAEEKSLYRTLRRDLMPGYVLMDRSQYLEEHFQSTKEQNPQSELLDAWLDFSALIYRAEPRPRKEGTHQSEKDDANWVLCDKPFPTGWIVPLMFGYRAILPVCDAEVVKQVRDEVTPTCFVESVHSIGEWLSVHRLYQIDAALWRQTFEEGWYLCRQVQSTLESLEPLTDIENLPFEDALKVI